MTFLIVRTIVVLHPSDNLMLIKQFYFLIFIFIMLQFLNPALSNDLTEIDSPETILMSSDLGEPIKLEARIDVPLELNLGKALSIALKQNLEIDVSEFERNINKWKYWENIGNFFPDYKVGLSDQRFSGNFLIGGVFPVMALTSNANAFMRFDYRFFEGGKGFFNTLAANNFYKSSKENLTSSINEVLLMAAKKYYQLLLEQSRLDVYARAVKEAKADYELNQNREKEGVGTKFDCLQSEAQLAEQEQLFISQQAKFRESSIALSRILNMPQESHIKPDLSDLIPKQLFNIEKPISELLSTAYKNRPEIKKANFEYSAQRNYIGVAFADFLPKADFYGQYGGTGNVFFHRTKIRETTPDAILLDDNGNPISQTLSRLSPLANQINLNDISQVSNVVRGAGKPFSSRLDDSLMANKFIGIQIDWDIANGFGVPAFSRINQARNQVKLYKTKIEQLNQQIEEQVRSAYLNVQTTEKLLRVAEKRVAAASEALRLAKLRLENGVGINTELLNAQKQHAGALVSQIDAIVNYNNSQIELLHSLGLISFESLIASH